MTDYSILKERVSVSEILTFYGYEPTRNGYISCPFHGEKTASLKVYDRSRTYHCFGCGAHGDVVDFVASIFSISNKEAAAKINTDFRLGLPFGTELDGDALRKMQAEADAKRRIREAAKKRKRELEEAYDLALGYWIYLDRILKEYAPSTPYEAVSDIYAAASRQKDYASYLIDLAEIKLKEVREM